MDERHRKILAKNRVYLTKNMDMASIVDHLSVLLSPDMMERITSQQTNRDKVVTFLNILEKRGPEAFPQFLDALTNSEFNFVRKRLEEDLNPVKRPVQEMRGTASR